MPGGMAGEQTGERNQSVAPTAGWCPISAGIVANQRKHRGVFNERMLHREIGPIVDRHPRAPKFNKLFVYYSRHRCPVKRIQRVISVDNSGAARTACFRGGRKTMAWGLIADSPQIRRGNGSLLPLVAGWDVLMWNERATMRPEPGADRPDERDATHHHL